MNNFFSKATMARLEEQGKSLPPRSEYAIKEDGKQYIVTADYGGVNDKSAICVASKKNGVVTIEYCNNVPKKDFENEVERIARFYNVVPIIEFNDEETELGKKRLAQLRNTDIAKMKAENKDHIDAMVEYLKEYVKNPDKQRTFLIK